jgi:mannose-6-phosphate isomerase-like protein (cupin superfamily)
VFLVLQGQVDMHYREAGAEKVVRLGPADMFIADVGDEHLARPVGEARVLVIERKGSV